MEKYDVINVVGEGSYGIVMKCKHRESGQYVAIKKFLETEDDPTVRKMAIREIRMLKKLRHENLVNMIEVFRRKKRFFLVFEYLEHTILEELESKTGGLGYTISRKYIYQILRALDFIHSHNVIHRDIKPENVLVSRLGVIKLCDFGFARSYTENETFTDYVATRWYRSPELLVGDPRYGKEVDIWAIGCLFAEMMTGEPLFPGESDIDQLFQIIRVLGKLNSKHQLLITKNSMFKGMKQEQNTNLLELFPDWNYDCLDFLSQCLKMDSLERPNAQKLLQHQLFTKDNFIINFLTELRTKIQQETQSNPLLKRLNFHYDFSINKSTEEKLKNINQTTGSSQMTISTATTTPTVSTISVTTATTTPTPIIIKQSSESSDKIFMNSSKDRLLTLNTHRPSYGTEEQLAPFRHYLTNAATIAAQSKQQQQQQQPQQQQQQIKQISINNLVFQDNSIAASSPSIANSNKLSRILSAKLQKPNQLNKINNLPLSNNNHNNQQQQQYEISSSPIPPFQSLQPDINHHHNHHNELLTMQGKRLSPVNNTLLSTITGQYFNQKRNSNTILNFQQSNGVLGNQKGGKSYLQNSQNYLKSSNFLKTSNRSSNLLDLSNIFPISTTTANTTNHLTVDSLINTKDTSPRILPPPTWLISGTTTTTNSNLKMNLTSQIPSVTMGTAASLSNKNIITFSNANNKKILTDWKAIAREPNDFLSPNCPGISITSTTTSTAHQQQQQQQQIITSTSPYKGNKKKLSPMSLTFQEKHLETATITGLKTNLINNQQTPRNYSACSDRENEN